MLDSAIASTPKEIIVSAARANKVEARLLSAICFVESSHIPSKINFMDGNEDSLGLCQVQLTTARYMGFKGSRRELMNPRTNAMYAAKYLAYQLKRYNGDVAKAVAAYNAGHYKEEKNCEYVIKVFKAYVEQR